MAVSRFLTAPVSARFARFARFMLSVSAAFWIADRVQGESSLFDFYFPNPPEWDESVPRPADHLGFEIGERHLYHHELTGYLARLAESSSRVHLWEFGKSYGGRPLQLLAVTSAANAGRLDAIQHTQDLLRDPARHAADEVRRRPLVLWYNHGVHGNEPSASNVVPLFAYHLAASKDRDLEQLLERTVVLIEPCVNPDGFERFAHWTNDNRGQTHPADRRHREHVEPWITGRLNYYWFDLNRDYLPLVDPGMRLRVARYYDWLPNLLLDYHEMSIDNSYFFQPGEPERDHPLTPGTVHELTARIAEANARVLDEAGIAYFTREVFDDFYMGKASTFGDIHGGVGILFEQSSSRGMRQTTRDGVLEFRDTIRNQLLTCLETLRAADRHRDDFLRYQERFYREAAAEAQQSEIAGYLLEAPGDPARMAAFLDLLRAHRIAFARIEGMHDIEVEGMRFDPRESFFVPVDQPAYRYLNAILEKRTAFAKEAFYDVTAWSLQLAYNLNHRAVPRAAAAELAFVPAPPEAELALQGRAPYPDGVAYAVDWRGYYAPKWLARLLDAGITVYYAGRDFVVETMKGPQHLFAGTLLIRSTGQEDRMDTVRDILEDAARTDRIRAYEALSSLTSAGVDLGSPSFRKVANPSVMLIGGRGTSPSAAGEIWHLLDYRMEIPLTIVETDRLHRTDLSDYTHIVVPGRGGGSIDRYVTQPAQDALADWVDAGGVLILLEDSILGFLGMSDDIRRLEGPAAQESAVAYADRRDHRAKQDVKGTILRTQFDPTHPLAFGLTGDHLPVFRTHRQALGRRGDPWHAPFLYSDEAILLMSGFLSGENRRNIAGTAAVLVIPRRQGKVIAILDNPAFRGHWYGTNRVFLNALFFGRDIQ